MSSRSQVFIQRCVASYIFPFVGALAVAIMLVIFSPSLVTWLPDLMTR